MESSEEDCESLERIELLKKNGIIIKRTEKVLRVLQLYENNDKKCGLL